MLLKNEIYVMDNLLLLNQKNNIKVVHLYMLPTETEFFNYFYSSYYLDYGAVTFVDKFNGKRTFLYNHNICTYVLNRIQQFHKNRITETELTMRCP